MVKTYLTMVPSLLLYVGAVVVGLAGGGGAAVLSLWSAFLLWHVVMRPAEWPRRAEDWTGAQWLRAGVAAAVLLALVAVCMLFGQGLALFVDWSWGVWPGVVLAVAATPLQRALVNPTKAAEMDKFLDEALVALKGIEAESARQTADEATMAARMAAERAAARDAVAGEWSDLPSLARRHAPHHLMEALSDLQTEGRLTRDRAAQVVDWACDPALSLDLQGQEAPYFAFSLVQEDPVLLVRFARACEALLVADPDAFWDCPSNEVLREVERGTDAAAASALRDLRRQQICVIRARLARERAEAREEDAETVEEPGP